MTDIYQLQAFPNAFWVTVCKTVRPVPCGPFSVCLSVCPVLHVMLVYCGQTVGRIKVKFGTQVGLGPGHIMLDRDPAPPPQKGAEPPIFGPYLLWPKGWMDQDATWHGGRSRHTPHCARWGSSSPSPKGQPQFSVHICYGQMAGWIKMPLGRELGLSPSDIVLDGDSAHPPRKGDRAPNIRPMSIVAKRLDGSRCHLVRKYRSQRKGHSSPPLFGPCLLWPRSPISATAELLFRTVVPHLTIFQLA